MLREKIKEMLDVFDSFGITENNQRIIIADGVNFDFTW